MVKLCGCGRVARYMISNEVFACNKYMRCKDAESKGTEVEYLRQQVAEQAELIEKLAAPLKDAKTLLPYSTISWASLAAYEQYRKEKA